MVSCNKVVMMMMVMMMMMVVVVIIIIIIIIIIITIILPETFKIPGWRPAGDSLSHVSAFSCSLSRDVSMKTLVGVNHKTQPQVE